MVENYNVNIEYLLLKVNFFKKVCAFFFYVFFFHSPNNKHIVDDWCSRNCDDALNITIFLLQQIFVGKFFNLLENEKSRMINVAKTLICSFGQTDVSF